MGFCSVVVITFASHAKGPRFDAGQKHYPITGRKLPAVWCVLTPIETVETLALSRSISRTFCAESQIKSHVIWPVSSVGQSVVLITPRSRVRSPYGPLEVNKEEMKTYIIDWWGKEIKHTIGKRVWIHGLCEIADFQWEKWDWCVCECMGWGHELWKRWHSPR